MLLVTFSCSPLPCHIDGFLALSRLWTAFSQDDEDNSEDEIDKTEEVIKVEITDNSIAQTFKEEEDRSKPIADSTTTPNTTSKAKPNITSKPSLLHIPQLIPNYYYPLYPHIIQRYPYNHFPQHLPVRVMFHCYPYC